MSARKVGVLTLSSQLGVCPKCGREIEGPGYGSGRLSDGLFCSLSCYAEFRELDGGPEAWASLVGGEQEARPDLRPEPSTSSDAELAAPGESPYVGRVYISGALTSVGDLQRARTLYESIASVCAEQRLEPYVPHLQTDPVHHADVPAVRVYEHDVREISQADLIVAYLGSASLGVGAELAIAAENETPIVALYRTDQRVSRFLLGLLRVHGSRELVADTDESLIRLLGEVAADYARRLDGHGSP